MAAPDERFTADYEYLKAGLLMSGFLVIYIFIVVVLYLRSRSQIYNEMIAFATQYGQVQRKLLKELALPYALLDEEGRVMWGNTAFFEASRKSRKGLVTVSKRY